MFMMQKALVPMKHNQCYVDIIIMMPCIHFFQHVIDLYALCIHNYKFWVHIWCGVLSFCVEPDDFGCILALFLLFCFNFLLSQGLVEIME